MGTSIQQRRPWPARISAPTAVALRREIARAHRRGELAASGAMYLLPAGGYAVDVLRLKAPQPHPYRRPLLVAGGVVATLGAAAAAGWWLASLVMVSLPLVAGGGTVLLLLRLTARRPGCTITITHRGHW